MKLPPIWLIMITVGLPILSETVYTPSLPQIAAALNTSNTLIEHTLTIYLFGFALGTLFWGRASDIYSRKNTMIAGFICYVLGCIGCYFSTSIDHLMISRLIQGTGGAVGSVLSQAITRDVFTGSELGRVFSSVGSAVPVFAGIGPVLGSFIAHYFGYASIFIFLALWGSIIILLVILKLPETHHKENRKKVKIFSLAARMITDRNVICCCLIVATINGITFSYHAEGPFFMIKNLGLFPTYYGMIGFCISAVSMWGGLLSRHLHSMKDSVTILGYGIRILLSGTAFFLIAIVIGKFMNFSNITMICIGVLSMMMIMFSIAMIAPNTLQIALVEYKEAVGSASSLLGFSYYVVISFFTYIMGILHNGTLFPMPAYFVLLAVVVLLLSKMREKRKNHC